LIQQLESSRARTETGQPDPGGRVLSLSPQPPGKGLAHVSRCRSCHRAGWEDAWSQFIKEKEIRRSSFILMPGSPPRLGRQAFFCGPGSCLSSWEGDPPGDTRLLHLEGTGHTLQLHADGWPMSVGVLPGSSRTQAPWPLVGFCQGWSPLFSQLPSLIQGVTLPGAFLPTAL